MSSSPAFVFVCVISVAFILSRTPIFPQSVAIEVLGCFQDGEPFIADIEHRLRTNEPLPSLVFIGTYRPIFLSVASAHPPL